VIGILKDKDIKTMLKIMRPLISKIIFTKSKHEKASNPQYLLTLFRKINQNKKFKTKIIENPKKALNYAKKIANKNDLIVVTGSVYLVGEVI
jgi:dihydrofolate synthase/folylpolyglutamate synthase